MSEQNELTERLSALLSDPEGLEQIKNMAAGLFGSNNSFEPQKPLKEQEDEGSLFPDIDMGKVLGLMSSLKSRTGENDKTRLLLALKPHLAAERQKKVDTAVKILKLLELAPKLSELGLFNL